MKKIKNLKMNKQVAFRGKVMRMLTPKNSHKLFKFENLVLDRFVKGTNIKGIKKQKNFLLAKTAKNVEFAFIPGLRIFTAMQKTVMIKPIKTKMLRKQKICKTILKKPLFYGFTAAVTP